MESLPADVRKANVETPPRPRIITKKKNIVERRALLVVYWEISSNLENVKAQSTRREFGM